MPAVLSKSWRANPLYNINKTWARLLKGLRLSVEGRWFKNFPRRRWKEWFVGAVIGYNIDTKLWKVRFDLDTDDIMALQYDSIIEYVDESAFNFNQYHLPISPVPTPSTTATVGATKYTMTDMIDWTRVFEETEHPPIPILPISFEGDQEEFDVDITAE